MRCMRGPRKKEKSGDLVWNSDDAWMNTITQDGGDVRLKDQGLWFQQI